MRGGRVRRPGLHGQGFAGLLDHIRSGRVDPDSNVAFLHTGDTGNLFEIPAVVGDVAPLSQRDGTVRLVSCPNDSDTDPAGMTSLADLAPLELLSRALDPSRRVDLTHPLREGIPSSPTSPSA
jgi:hypothetical protein